MPRSATCASCSRNAPATPTVQNAFGYTLAGSRPELDEAQSLVCALRSTQTPDSAAVLDSMGWVLFRQGNYAEALQYLQRARDLGNDAEIDLHLGEVQWALGDQDEARKTWQDAARAPAGDAPLKERLERAGP